MLNGAETQDERAGMRRYFYPLKRERAREGEKGVGVCVGKRTGRSRAESGAEGREKSGTYMLGAGEGTGLAGKGLPLSCFQSLMACRSAPPAPADSPLSVSLCD